MCNKNKRLKNGVVCVNCQSPDYVMVKFDSLKETKFMKEAVSQEKNVLVPRFKCRDCNYIYYHLDNKYLAFL